MSNNLWIPNGGSHLYGASLGNILGFDNFAVEVDQFRTQSQGMYIFCQGGLTASLREAGVYVLGADWNVFIGGENTRIGATTDIFGAGGADVSKLGFYADLVNATYELYEGTRYSGDPNDYTVLASGALNIGTARVDGMLFRLGARGSTNDSSAGGGFFADNTTRFGDTEVFVNGAKVHEWPMPSSGAQVADSVGSNSLTLDSPSGDVDSDGQDDDWGVLVATGSISGANALGTMTITLPDTYTSPVSDVTINGISQSNIVEVDSNNVSVTLGDAGVRFGSSVSVVVTDATGALPGITTTYDAPQGFDHLPLVDPNSDLTSDGAVSGDEFAYRNVVVFGGNTYNVTSDSSGNLSSADAVEGLEVEFLTQDASGTPAFAMSNIASAFLGENEAPVFASIPALSFTAGDTVSFDVSQYVSDSDARDETTYAMSPSTVAGLTLDSSTGLLSGTALETTSVNVTFTATDLFGQSGSSTSSVEVSSVVAPTPTPTPTAPTPTPTPSPAPTPTQITVLVKWQVSARLSDNSDVAEGATVRILSSEGVQQTVFSDAEGVSEITNITTDAGGQAEFYVAAGDYIQELTFDGETTSKIVKIYDIGSIQNYVESLRTEFDSFISQTFADHVSLYADRHVIHTDMHNSQEAKIVALESIDSENRLSSLESAVAAIVQANTDLNAVDRIGALEDLFGEVSIDENGGVLDVGPMRLVFGKTANSDDDVITSYDYTFKEGTETFINLGLVRDLSATSYSVGSGNTVGVPDSVTAYDDSGFTTNRDDNVNGIVNSYFTIGQKPDSV